MLSCHKSLRLSNCELILAQESFKPTYIRNYVTTKDLFPNKTFFSLGEKEKYLDQN